LVLSPTGSINLGFITEGRLAAVLITPSLGVPNWSVIYINTAPSILNVDLGASNGHHHALVDVGNKPGDLSKVLENAGKHLHIIFFRGHKDNSVIRI
jgi:hypothetical protein